jgi:hypothetical protein
LVDNEDNRYQTDHSGYYFFSCIQFAHSALRACQLRAVRRPLLKPFKTFKSFNRSPASNSFKPLKSFKSLKAFDCLSPEFWILTPVS